MFKISYLYLWRYDYNKVPVGHIMISLYCRHPNVSISFEIKIGSEQNVNSLKTIYFKEKPSMGHSTADQRRSSRRQKPQKKERQTTKEDLLQIYLILLSLIWDRGRVIRGKTPRFQHNIFVQLFKVHVFAKLLGHILTFKKISFSHPRI